MTIRLFGDFCESTSLHGYSYLYNSDSLILKLFWLIVILSMSTTAIFFLASNAKEYFDAKIQTSTEYSSAPVNVS